MRAEGNAAAVELERVKLLQRQLASSTDLNPISELVWSARALHKRVSDGGDDAGVAKAQLLAARIATRSLAALCEQDRIDFSHADGLADWVFE